MTPKPSIHSPADAQDNKRDPDRPSPFFEAAKVSSVGIEMAVATVAGWSIGYWLDGKFDSGPYLMLVGLLFGIAAGFNGLIRTANQVNDRQKRDAQALAGLSESPEGLSSDEH